MSESDGDRRAKRLERALEEEQHEERAEQTEQLLQEQRINDRVAEALTRPKKDDADN